MKSSFKVMILATKRIFTNSAKKFLRIQRILPELGLVVNVLLREAVLLLPTKWKREVHLLVY